MNAVLVHNSYGKARVRLLFVDRSDPVHRIRDLSVTTTLSGAFGAAYTDGDNSAVLTTDAMKNTVLALARDEIAGRTLEHYATVLGGRFLDVVPAATEATVRVEEADWRRSTLGGAEHPHAFETGGPERFVAEVAVRRDGGLDRAGGIVGLRLLKTTGSAFSGFLREDYSTMADIVDRVFAPVIDLRWDWSADETATDRVRAQVRTTVVEEFAGHDDSASAQHSSYVVCAALLAAYPGIDSLRIDWPGRLHHLVDLTPFGRDNPGMVYVPSDETPGFVTAQVSRQPSPRDGSV